MRDRASMPPRGSVAAALRAAADFIEESDPAENGLLSFAIRNDGISTTIEFEVRDFVVEDTGATVTVKTIAAPIGRAFRAASEQRDTIPSVGG